MDLKPWAVSPALTEEKLSTLASIIRDVRRRALELHNENEGDDVWSLGCRIYERTINTLESHAEEASWLTIVRQGLYFVMFVDSVPIRFYKGMADEPTNRTLRRQYPELEHEQGSFQFYAPTWFWRIAIETHGDGSVSRIVIAQFAADGTSRNKWVIFDSSVPALSVMDNSKQEAVVLAELAVTPLEETIYNVENA